MKIKIYILAFIIIILNFKIYSQNNLFDFLKGGLCNYKTAVPFENGKCLSGDWVLVFEDEFNDNKLDNNKWFSYFGYGDRCHGDEPQAYLDENILINNGILHLQFKEHPDNYTMCGNTSKWKKYSSGLIYSKQSFLFGIFEAEIKIPEGQGFWPAFWLWGSENNKSGEIDIFEFFGIDNSKVFFSSHRWTDNNDNLCQTNYKSNSDYSNSYHTYSIYWDPFFIAYFIDGNIKSVHWLWYTILGQSGITCSNLKAMHEYILSKTFPYSNIPLHIIVNLAGQKSPTPLPNELLVKSVKVWGKKDNACDDITIKEISKKQPFSSLPINITGKKITIDGDIILESDKKCNLTAENKIIIKPGLKILKGSQFNAIINPNLCQDFNLKSTKEKYSPKIKLTQIDSLDNLIENTNTELVDIYPNPFNEILTIYSLRKGKALIIDIKGIVYYNFEINNNLNILNLSFLPNGIYVAKLILDNNVYIKKIIKN